MPPPSLARHTRGITPLGALWADVALSSRFPVGLISGQRGPHCPGFPVPPNLEERAAHCSVGPCVLVSPQNQQKRPGVTRTPGRWCSVNRVSGEPPDLRYLLRRGRCTIPCAV